mgnify:CR=1 FL=1
MASLTASRRIRLLILGGTGFTGPHQVRYAVARGHHVTVFNRGRRQTELPDGVVHLQGDRNAPDGLAALEREVANGTTWDVVIETSGYRHAWTRAAVAALRAQADRYVYISSTGVFWPYHTVDIAEDGRVLLTDDPPQELPTYGVMKALSENEVREGFGERAGTSEGETRDHGRPRPGVRLPFRPAS